MSEALYFCKTENVDAIVIAADVEDPDVVEAQMRRITIKLKPEATAKELIWELARLFPKGSHGAVNCRVVVPHLAPRKYPIERERGVERLTSSKLPFEAALPRKMECREEKAVELK